MFEYIRAIREIRPTWLLWENVPGVLNVRDNAFAQLLEELSIIGYGLAWRCFDAQFFDLAQRRKRVFLVGHLGNGGGAAAVLFNSESVSGFTQSPQRKRQELAEADGKSANPTIQCMTNTTYNAALDVDMCGTLLAGGGEPPIVIVPKAYTLKMRGGKDTYIKRDGTTGTAGKGALVGDNCAFTLSCSQDQTLFAYDEIAKDYVARKFTPREEERLQGFPDDWTKVPYRGKPADECPDAPRYKAMGNSMAVPVMRWLGERITMVDSLQKEMQKIS
jgi:DNA (cytosine-5)-methyltransferase 1